MTGHPRKVRVPGWLALPAFRLLAAGRRYRGTSLDLFGRTAERRLERQMIADYEDLLEEIASRLTPATHATAVALAALPLEVKGFGHVKLANYRTAKAREAALLAQLRAPTPGPVKIAAE